MFHKKFILPNLISLLIILAFSIHASADENKGPAIKGDEVSIEYMGTLEDGTVFDSSEKHGMPLKFVLGKSRILPKFEAAVMGMKVGEKKTFTLKPKDAYGEYDPRLTKLIPRNKLPLTPDPQPGMTLGAHLSDGRKAAAIIKKVTADGVLVDLNPPLAGKTLTFNIHLIEIAQKS